MNAVTHHADMAQGWRAWLPPMEQVVWFGCLSVVVAVAAWIRVDVQALRSDLARIQVQTHEVAIQHEQLQLELDTLRRSVSLEHAAHRSAMGPVASVRTLSVGR